MKPVWFVVAACVISWALPAAEKPPDPTILLAKAAAAYDRNQQNAQHWNWTAVETRSLTDKSGAVLQNFPSVTAESVIRSEGKRCNAVVEWGDKLKPYLADADPDSRCRAMDEFRMPFEVSELLKSGQVRMAPPTGAGVVLLISPDKVRMRADDPAVRCAASIEATVRLDHTTYFPLTIDGKVTEKGCDQTLVPVVQYGRDRPSSPMRSSFRKGAEFRMEFGLQKDKFGNAGNSFWLCVKQHYVFPWDSANEVLVYWGRQVAVTAKRPAHQLVKDIQTSAREFGASSQPRFDKVGQY
jgi:hypothetical protein